MSDQGTTLAPVSGSALREGSDVEFVRPAEDKNKMWFWSLAAATAACGFGIWFGGKATIAVTTGTWAMASNLIASLPFLATASGIAIAGLTGAGFLLAGALALYGICSLLQKNNDTENKWSALGKTAAFTLASVSMGIGAAALAISGLGLPALCLGIAALGTMAATWIFGFGNTHYKNFSHSTIEGEGDDTAKTAMFLGQFLGVPALAAGLSFLYFSKIGEIVAATTVSNALLAAGVAPALAAIGAFAPVLLLGVFALGAVIKAGHFARNVWDSQGFSGRNSQKASPYDKFYSFETKYAHARAERKAFERLQGTYMAEDQAAIWIQRAATTLIAAGIYFGFAAVGVALSPFVVGAFLIGSLLLHKVSFDMQSKSRAWSEIRELKTKEVETLRSDRGKLEAEIQWREERLQSNIDTLEMFGPVDGPRGVVDMALVDQIISTNPQNKAKLEKMKAEIQEDLKAVGIDKSGTKYKELRDVIIKQLDIEKKWGRGAQLKKFSKSEIAEELRRARFEEAELIRTHHLGKSATPRDANGNPIMGAQQIGMAGYLWMDLRRSFIGRQFMAIKNAGDAMAKIAGYRPAEAAQGIFRDTRQEVGVRVSEGLHTVRAVRNVARDAHGSAGVAAGRQNIRHVSDAQRVLA